jgi:hypothetical protein
LTGNTPALLILNLDSLKSDITQLGDVARGRSFRCVGYYSHVNIELAEKAKGAEIDVIIPRGVFLKRIGAIMAQVLRG